MKYDLLQIIKDKIKILEDNKLASKILEKELSRVPANKGIFENDTLYLSNNKKENECIELFPKSNRIDIGKDKYNGKEMGNYKTSILIKDDKCFDYQCYMIVPGKEYYVLVACTISFEYSKIVSLNFGLWNYDMKIRDFSDYSVSFLEEEALKHTLFAYPSFEKIQRDIHEDYRLLPDYYEKIEINALDDKYIYNYNFNGTCEKTIVDDIDLTNFMDVLNRSPEYSNCNYIVRKLASTENILSELRENKEKGDEEEKLENLVNFYVNTLALKDIIRTGWDKEHWNVSKERLESIAEHTYSTMILALSMYNFFDYRDIDINKVYNMLLIHDLGEKILGDIPEFDSRKNSKKEQELIAFKEMVFNLPNKENLINLFIEFSSMETPESIFANLCDKLDCDINAKNYEDLGYNHITGQEHNKAFNSEEIQEILSKGFNTVADCFIEYDAKHYQIDDNFMKVLRYVQKNNIHKKEG